MSEFGGREGAIASPGFGLGLATGKWVSSFYPPSTSVFNARHRHMQLVPQHNPQSTGQCLEIIYLPEIVVLVVDESSSELKKLLNNSKLFYLTHSMNLLTNVGPSLSVNAADFL